MNLVILASFAAAAICVALAVAVFCLKRQSWGWAAVGFGILLFAVDTTTAGFILDTVSPGDAAFWEDVRMISGALIPSVWLIASLCHARGNHREFLRRWRVFLVLSFLAPAAILFLTWKTSLSGKVYFSPGGSLVFIGMGTGGKLLNGCELLASIVILMNFERTFRTALGVMRWRIKYFIIGAGLLFGSIVYGSSQTLLYSGVHILALKIHVLMVFFGSGLIAFSFIRTRIGDSEIYPSHKVLQHSLALGLAVAYLLGVGLLADLVTRFGGDPGFPLKALVFLLGIVGVTLLLLSDRVRQQAGLFVSRNFRRPMHDYRKVWALFTEKTGSLMDLNAFCRAVVNLFSETFELLSVTLWIVNDADKALVFGASTSLTEKRASLLALSRNEFDEFVKTARSWGGPVDMDRSGERGHAFFQRLNPDHFQKGGNRACIPLVSGGTVLGVVTVADRVSGRRFTVEDFDLLKCMGDEVAGRLRNFELGRQLLQNKEMEAFQTMSAFFVHDLKNTASTLSLMLQNLSVHFGDPVFREDCQRSLSRSVGHINGLISRLTLLRHELKMRKSAVDLNELISTVLNEIAPAGGVEIKMELKPVPKVQADSEQVQKVVTNLVLNARESMKGGGTIRVETGRENGWAHFSVADTGCGMTDEFVRQSLFKPFQTTKKSGLGIGLFHSKAIVEAHQGRIEVQSALGQGTTFRVLLPLEET